MMQENNNIELFRRHYRQQLQLVLNQFRPKLSEVLELSGDIQRLKNHPKKDYYYLTTLAMAEQRLKEIS